jgi:S1-C subfamily serine protease
VDVGGLVRQVATGVPAGRGRVLTVAHVLSDARGVRVGERVARIVSIDRRRDVAVLAVAGVRAPAARYAQGGDVVRVHLLGQTVSARVLRRVIATLDGASRPALELAVTVRPGDSGAPVTDERGRLVGLVFARGQHSAWAVRLTE